MSKNRIPLLAGVALSAFTASSAALAQDHSFCLEDTFTNAGDGDDRVINLAISLYGQAPAGSDDRARYESVFRSFARGVYEATNGAHYIGELTIYQNGAQKRFADIIWGRGTTDAEWRE